MRQKNDALEREKSNSIKKNNFLKILENIEAIFTGAYLRYGEMPKETIFERNVAESVKLRRGRIAEIEEEENIKYKLFNDYFINYQSPVICTKNYARQKMKEMRIEYM